MSIFRLYRVVVNLMHNALDLLDIRCILVQAAYGLGLRLGLDRGKGHDDLRGTTAAVVRPRWLVVGRPCSDL